MPIGDDAANAGIDTPTGLEPANTLHTIITALADELARRTQDVAPITKGGTGATTAAQALTNLGAVAVARVSTDGNVSTAGLIPIYNDDRQLTAAAPTLDGHVTNLAWVVAYAPSRQTVQQLHDSVADGNMSPDIYSRAIAGNSVYITSGGRLGHVASAARFKDVCGDAELDVDAIRRVRVRAYTYRPEYALGGDVQIGVIAEELEALGLDWLVGYDDAGEPLTVHYERLGLLALELAQDNARRLDELEARLAGLEGVAE